MALVAAALEGQAIGGVALHGALGSLKEVIEQNWGVAEKPELFCFGLLESFDIKQLAALLAPRPVTICRAQRSGQDRAGRSGCLVSAVAKRLQSAGHSPQPISAIRLARISFSP